MPDQEIRTATIPAPLPRVLTIHIANGDSPEWRVPERLLSEMNGGSNIAVLMHQYMGGQKAPLDRIERTLPRASVQTLDFGWRYPGQGRVQKSFGQLHFLKTLPRATQIARQMKVELVYSSQQLWDCRAATYIARRLHIPQVIHLHYIIGPWLHHPILQRLRTCERIVTVSDFIRQQALDHGAAPERVTTVLNPGEPYALTAAEAALARTALRDELGIPQNAPVVGIVARLDPYKGQKETLEAFARVLPEFPDAYLIICGAASAWLTNLEKELTAHAESLGLGKRALFLGYRRDVPRVLAALDVFMHPSRDEPFGLSLLEASAASLPVVAWAQGGACEIIEDTVTGLLAPLDDMDKLAASLRTLLADTDRARAMGLAGKKRADENFRPEDASAKLARIFTETAAAKR